MNDTVYNSFLLVAAALIALAFLILTWRIAKGPDSLDRVLGLDGFTASLQCALCIFIAWSIDTTVVGHMVVIALLGFISQVSVARFRKRDGA